MTRVQGAKAARCGTAAGYWRHLRHDQSACLSCRLAVDQYNDDLKLAPERRAILDAEVAIYEKRRGRTA
jgi:hypothetical protein